MHILFIQYTIFMLSDNTATHAQGLAPKKASEHCGRWGVERSYGQFSTQRISPICYQRTCIRTRQEERKEKGGHLLIRPFPQQGSGVGDHSSFLAYTRGRGDSTSLLFIRHRLRPPLVIFFFFSSLLHCSYYITETLVISPPPAPKVPYLHGHPPLAG